RPVPTDDLAAGIPGLARKIARGAIVEDAPVDRPRERPLRIDAGVFRIAVVAPRHLVAGLGEAAGIDPATAGGRAVVPQRGEARKLLAGGHDDLRRIVRIREIGDRVAVDFAR